MSRKTSSHWTTINSLGSSPVTYVSTPPRAEFRADLLREHYADDPVVLAMIDYIEELLASGGRLRDWSYTFTNWPTLTTTSTVSITATSTKMP